MAGWYTFLWKFFLVLLDRSGWEHKTLFVLCVMRCVCGNCGVRYGRDGTQPSYGTNLSAGAWEKGQA